MILPGCVTALAVDTVTTGSLHMILPSGFDGVALSSDVASSLPMLSSSLMPQAPSSSNMPVMSSVWL